MSAVLHMYSLSGKYIKLQEEYKAIYPQKVQGKADLYDGNAN